jgi:ABC-2 type transport system permease protein
MDANHNQTLQGRNLPSDIEQVKVVAKYDVLKYIRSRRLLGILVIEIAVLALMTAVLVTSNRPYNVNEVLGQYTGFVNILIILGATLFGGDAIVSEYQSRTGYLLFPNPVKKGSIMAGKFISSVAAMTLMLVIYYAVAFIAAFFIGHGFTVLGLASLGLALLYGITAISVAFLISSVMKGSTGALILTFALFLFVFNIVSSLMGQLGGIKPWFMIDFAGQSMNYIVMNPYPVDHTVPVDIGGGQLMNIHYFYPDVIISIAVMVVYAVVAIALAYFFFTRREMSA